MAGKAQNVTGKAQNVTQSLFILLLLTSHINRYFSMIV